MTDLNLIIRIDSVRSQPQNSCSVITRPADTVYLKATCQHKKLSHSLKTIVKMQDAINSQKKTNHAMHVTDRQVHI